ncbi:AraC family transcriptional regulator [Achromobacter sp. K91]|uniref:helix-turn-helix domain-containing protein n=1 Tax=Achromobacter sp. K91 TaxID=2292262 RepID=UPI001314AE44|nr:helix-turn-helix domain-containing protein [Achromobacter sp. K91]
MEINGLRSVAQDAVTETACPISRAQPGGISLLLVSDRLDDFQPLVFALREQLFNVTTVEDGWDAYYRTQVKLPTAIVIDAELRTFDSITLCRLLRRAGLTPRAGVLLATRNSSAELRICALRLGVLDVLTMPLVPEEVMLRFAYHRRSILHRCGVTSTCAMRADSSKGVSRLVERAMSLVEEFGESTKSTKHTARAVGTNARSLSLAFKNETGESFSAYSKLKKIQLACRLLRTTTMPINQIAATIGYQSACNFSVAFRHRMNMAPSSYRKQYSSE